MLLYALDPGTPLPAPERGDDPFYPYNLASVAYNVCVLCFHEMAAHLREEKYVGIRGTGVIPGKPKQA